MMSELPLPDELATPSMEGLARIPHVAIVSHIYLERASRGKLPLIGRQVQLTVIMPARFRFAYGMYTAHSSREPDYTVRVYRCLFPLPMRSSTRWILGSFDLGFRQSAPDIVHIENEIASFSVLQALVCRRLFAPRAKVIVFAWANMPVRGVKGLVLRVLARLTIPRIDHFIVGNQAARALLEAQGVQEPRISVCPVVGVDEALLSTTAASTAPGLRRELGISPHE